MSRPSVIALALALAAGCTPARGTGNVGAPQAEGSSASGDGGSALPPADADAPRVCVHDAKDLAPCAEDCDRGIVFACTAVATRTERGDGVAKDLTRAVHHYERACDLHDAPSCVNAARMHVSGRGVPPSRVRQIQLLSIACRLGDAHACSIPAKAFASGNDVPRDERRAAELWQRACAGGDEAACAEVERATP